MPALPVASIVMKARCSAGRADHAKAPKKKHQNAQRHDISSIVSEGRFHTSAMTPTKDCVPRTGGTVEEAREVDGRRRSLHHQVYELALHNNRLGDGLARDTSDELLVVHSSGLNDLFITVRRNFHHGNELAVDLHGNFDLVFASEL